VAGRVAWLLNLDAEDELRSPGPTTTSAATRSRIEALVPLLQGSLVAPGDLVLDPAAIVPGSASGLRGEAWCPTPGALGALRRAGAFLPEAPSLSALRQANSRALCASLGQPLPGAVYELLEDEVEQAVRGPSPTGQWLLKRPFGFAGRGRLRVAEGALTDDARRWVRASLRGGQGLQVEPWMERQGDFALHGLLGADGSLSLGKPTRQVCTPLGVWERSERAPDALSPGELGALVEATREAAAALTRVGYFGPFNVDAFRYLDARGRLAFNPRCEINARYSMGWATGMRRFPFVTRFTR
jgi:hypothetical protein